MKRLLALLLILAMGIAMSACVRSDVVAVVGKESIHAPQALEVYDFVTKQTLYSYAMYYGITIEKGDKDYTDFVASMKNQTLNLMAQNVGMEQKLNELGLALTEEELLQITESAQGEYDDIVASLYTVEEEDDEAAQEEKAQEARQTVDDMGYSLQALTYMAHYEKVESKLYDKVAEGVVPFESEIEALYDSKLAEQRGNYLTSPDAFITDVLNSALLYLQPDGYRYVKNIVIAFEAETSEKLSALESDLYTAQQAVASLETELAQEGDDALAGDERAEHEAQLADEQAKVAQLDADLEAQEKLAYEEIRELAEEVLAKCQAEDADFDAILAEYSEDYSSNPAIQEHGYPVCEGTGVYVPSFTEGAMALETVGQVSGLIESPYGYHILKYTGDVTPTVTPLETVRGDITAEVVKTKQDNAFSEMLNYWLSNMNIKLYTSRLKVD